MITNTLEQIQEGGNDMDVKKDPHFNGSGYYDPTAFKAISSVDRDAKTEAAVKKLLATIFYICDLAGFHLENRLELKDKKTGKIWR